MYVGDWARRHRIAIYLKGAEGGCFNSGDKTVLTRTEFKCGIPPPYGQECRLYQYPCLLFRLEEIRGHLQFVTCTLNVNVVVVAARVHLIVMTQSWLMHRNVITSQAAQCCIPHPRRPEQLSPASNPDSFIPFFQPGLRVLIRHQGQPCFLQLALPAVPHHPAVHTEDGVHGAGPLPKPQRFSYF